MNTEAKDCDKRLNELLEFVIAEKNFVRETGYHDDKVMGTAFETVQLKIESLMSNGNNATLESAKCNKHDVSNLSKFCKQISQQKDCPAEFVDIVNKEFWNLI